jgi:hypothetical protein
VHVCLMLWYLRVYNNEKQWNVVGVIEKCGELAAADGDRQ